MNDVLSHPSPNTRNSTTLHNDNIIISRLSTRPPPHIQLKLRHSLPQNHPHYHILLSSRIQRVYSGEGLCFVFVFRLFLMCKWLCSQQFISSLYTLLFLLNLLSNLQSFHTGRDISNSWFLIVRFDCNPCAFGCCSRPISPWVVVVTLRR